MTARSPHRFLLGLIGRAPSQAPRAPRRPWLAGRSRAALSHALALAVTAALVAGCGSSGGSADGGGGGSGNGSGPMTWTEDGTQRTATFATAAMATVSNVSTLQVTGADSAQNGISFGVQTAPPIVPGTYACGIDQATGLIGSLAYTQGSDSYVWQSCTIVFSTIGSKTGDRAEGTFSAVVADTSGATTKTISAGTFDVSLTVSAF